MRFDWDSEKQGAGTARFILRYLIWIGSWIVIAMVAGLIVMLLGIEFS